MANYQLSPTGLLNGDTGEVMLESNDSFTVNGVKVRRLGSYGYECTMWFGVNAGGYPTCPNKLSFNSLGKMYAGMVNRYEIRITEQHRGMTVQDYTHLTDLVFSGEGDGLFFHSRSIGQAGLSGIIYAAAYQGRDNPAKNQYGQYRFDNLGFVGASNAVESYQSATAVNINTSWNWHKLCIYAYPSCGSDKAYLATIRWYGNKDGFIPLLEQTYSTNTNVATAISNSDSAIPTLIG